MKDQHETAAETAHGIPAYAELACLSNFSFLRGGSHPGELVTRAEALGIGAIGLCDRNSFAGVVRAHVGARHVHEQGGSVRYLTGVRLCFADGTPDILAYPTDRPAYGRLCALLTIGNRRAGKGDCHLFFADLAGHAEGQLFALLPDETDWEKNRDALQGLVELAPDRVWIAAACRHDGSDRARLNRIAGLGGCHNVQMLAVNDVLYHTPQRRALQDVLTCIREHVPIHAAGRRLEKNAERHLKPPQEMARLFREHPDAITETIRFAGMISFSLNDLRYNYPEETVGNGETAQQTLERLTLEGAKRRYPDKIPFKVKRLALTELRLIAEKRYAAYFLTVHDLVRFAREERNILCQGRGSAANSTVCFCLGVTEVDPMVGNLVFGRFISTERDEPPDIDIDFEHERREEVIQYLYEKYGRDRAALTATLVTYRSRSAIREVGKVFALSEDMITAINGLSWGWHSTGVDAEKLRELGLDRTDPTLKQTIDLVGQLIGFPRHLSQHVGGFVLTGDRLDHTCPIHNAAMQDRTTVEWDKNDLDALGILKVDVLALGMLTCIRRAFDMMRLHYDKKLQLAEVMRDQDARVYQMIQRADTLGTFQIESRAQMSMLPRLRPKEFYDLVIEVAIVRPGPIQGGMVHPYLKRRQGLEKPEKFGSALDAVLDRTLGIPLFQEQAMQIAIVAGGFSPGEADQLRRAMATFRNQGTIGSFRERMITGMLSRGYEKTFAERCFAQIEGFADYGFPESHAASFALLVWVSCWLKCFYPDVFAAALLNSQPMGFYAPAQIVRDAREHGVETRDVDVNLSDVEASLEPGQKAADHLWPRHAEMKPHLYATHAVRLGLMKIKGLKLADAECIRARRGRGYDSVRDLWLRTGLSSATLEKLADADAFRSLGLDRRAALWAVAGLKGPDGAGRLPLFAAAQNEMEYKTEAEEAGLPPMPLGEHVVNDYRTLSLSLKQHPVAFFREGLKARNFLSAEDLGQAKNGQRGQIAGLVLVRQRPGTASGVIFATLEDETGAANVIVWPKIFEKYRRAVLGSRFMAVRGQIQREGEVIHVIAHEVTDLTADLMRLGEGPEQGVGQGMLKIAGSGTPANSGDIPGAARTEAGRSQAARHPRNVTIFPPGRNFH